MIPENSVHRHSGVQRMSEGWFEMVIRGYPEKDDFVCTEQRQLIQYQYDTMPWLESRTGDNSRQAQPDLHHSTRQIDDHNRV